MKDVKEIIREELWKLVETPENEIGQGERDPIDNDPEFLRRYIRNIEKLWKKAQQFVADTNDIMMDDLTSNEEKLYLIDRLLAAYG
jgi:hypothetical protein